MVDEWPIEWSTGWLLREAVVHETDQKKFYEYGIGFAGEDPDVDPWWEEAQTVEPPVGWENLPRYEPGEEVSGGE